MQVIWVMVNCNSVREAECIGLALLRKRLCACFDVLPRLTSGFFWPPKSGKIARAKGAQLILVTLPKLAAPTTAAVQKMHSDKVPMIGRTEMAVTAAYGRWVRGELQNHA